MCELIVIVNEVVVFENVIYAKAFDNSIVKDIREAKRVQGPLKYRSQHNQRIATSFLKKHKTKTRTNKKSPKDMSWEA